MTCTWVCGKQVKRLIEAADEDKIGRYATGAMERVMTKSEEALNTINASSAM